MLCYRDMTFCASDCTNAECSRFVSPRIEAEVARLDMAMAMSDFSKSCDEYKPPIEVVS